MPIYAMVLVIDNNEYSDNVIGVVNEAPNIESATAWFMGYIAGGKFSVDPASNAIDIFEYTGSGGIPEAMDYLTDAIKAGASETGGTLVEIIEPDMPDGVIEPIANMDVIEWIDAIDDFVLDAMIAESQIYDDENGQLAHICTMCGVETGNVDAIGMCSQCRQIWNS